MYAINCIAALKTSQLLSMYRTSPLFVMSCIKLLPVFARSILFSLFSRGHLDYEYLRSEYLKVSNGLSAVEQTTQLTTLLCLLTQIKMIVFENALVKLDKEFEEAFKKAVSVVRETTTEKDQRHEESEKKYEQMLFGIVDSRRLRQNGSLIRLLVSAGLVSQELVISSKGFNFLLKTKREQLWILISNYLKTTKSPTSVLQTLFTFCINIEREIELKNILEIEFLNILEEIGLVNRRGEYVRPNNMLKYIFLDAEKEMSGSLIVETNYRIYAYTNSDYEISILRLFCDITQVFPNMTCGLLNEESIKRALDKQIEAEQINAFLLGNAKVVNEKKLVSSTILDQIVLWKKKRTHLHLEESVLYDNFLNFADYEKTFRFCEQHGAVAAKHEEKRIIIVKKYFVAKLKEFLKAA